MRTSDLDVRIHEERAAGGTVAAGLVEGAPTVVLVPAFKRMSDLPAKELEELVAAFGRALDALSRRAR